MNNIDDKDAGFFTMKSHLFCNIGIFFSGLMVFLFVPFYFLTPDQLQQTFNNGRGLEVARDILILSGFFYLVIAAIYWVFALTRFRQLGAFFVLFSLLWITLSGFLLPLTTANGADELGLAPTRPSHLILVALLSFVAAFLWLSKHSKIITIFFATFLAVSILPSLVRAVSIFEDRSETVFRIPFSQKENLLLITFDGIPGHVVTELLGENPELEKEFKDFLYFDNVTSTAPSTKGSVAGIMLGNHDVNSNDSSQTAPISDLFLNDAEKYDFTTTAAYSPYNVNGTSITAGQFGEAEQRNELYSIYRSVFARLFTAFGVRTLDLLDYALGPKRDGKFYSTVLGVDSIMSMLDKGGDKPSIVYVHFVFTHYPAVIDENCEFRGQDQAWVNSHQNRAGMKAGAICALSKYRQFIKTLKELGIYDNTVIAFASDHGKLSYFYEEMPYKLLINNHRNLGVGRYRPMLMIKDAGRMRDQLERDNRHVLLDDLAKTLCVAIEDSPRCELTSGVNVLDANAKAPDDFLIHLPVDENSTWRMHTMQAVSLPREKPLEQAMRDSDEVVLSMPGDR